jgi:hypothetical protein
MVPASSLHTFLSLFLLSFRVLEARTESNSTFGKILQNGTIREIQAESRKSSRTVKSKVEKDEIITSQKTRILNLENEIKHMKTVLDY